jgi:hypothetical protein
LPVCKSAAPNNTTLTAPPAPISSLHFWRSIAMQLLKSLSKHTVLNIAVSVIIVSTGHIVFYLFG